MAGFFDGAAGGIFSGGLNLAGGIWQQFRNEALQKKAMDFQRSEREAMQRYQTSEREAMQGYQTSERNAQNLWQESMYGKYQSPEAMIRQYQNAGINGVLAVGSGNNLGTMSVSGGSNGGAPSSGSPSGHAPTPPYQNVNAMSAGFADIAGALKAIAESKRLGIETNYLEDMLKEQLNQSRITSKLMDIDFDAKRLTALPMAQAALDKLMAEAKKENLNLSVINKQLDILENQRIITKAQADTAKERVQAELLKISAEANELNARAEVHVADKFLKEEQAKTQGSIRYLNYETAKLRTLEQDTEKEQPELSKSIADLNRSIGALNWFENRYNQFNKDDIWDARNAENKSRVKVAEETANQAEIATAMALTEKRWQVAEHIVGVLLNAGATVLVGGKAVKGAKEAVDLFKKSKGKIGFKFD